MKYRIKITTFKNGRKEYLPQVKLFFIWFSISFDGSIDFLNCVSSVDTREYALNKIDKHFDGNTKKQTIYFEYIKKG